MSDDAAPSIGIDLGGTNIKAVRVNAAGQVLARHEQPTGDDHSRSKPDAQRSILGAVSAAIAAVGGDAAGRVGLACPGLARPDNRVIAWMRGRLEMVEGLDWTAALNRPIPVINDAHAATIGEAWCGAAVGRSHVVLLTLGTGVGGGVIVSGRLVQGAMGRAGHLGHMSLDPHGSLDLARTPGSIEDAIGDHTVAARTGGRFADTQALVRSVAACDTEAVTHWLRSVDALAAHLVSLINAFDPQVIVLGGGIAKAGPHLFDPLRRRLDQIEWRPTGTAVPIVAATLGSDAGAIGAARFAMRGGDA